MAEIEDGAASALWKRRRWLDLAAVLLTEEDEKETREVPRVFGEVSEMKWI